MTIRLTRTLLLLPVIAALSSCSQAEVTLPSSRVQLVRQSQTAAPVDFVQYPDDRPSIAQGKKVFDSLNCASCHNGDDSPAGAADLKRGSSLSLKKPVELYRFIAYGKKDAGHDALKNTLSNKEIWNLVFYTRSLAAAALSPAEISRLDPVFGSNCAVCHGTRGDGDGPLARNLEPNPANFQSFPRFFDRTDEVLYDHIARGIKGEAMPGFLDRQDKRKNFQFNQENINKLVQYVRHFQVSNENFSETPAKTEKQSQSEKTN